MKKYRLHFNIITYTLALIVFGAVDFIAFYIGNSEVDKTMIIINAFLLLFLLIFAFIIFKNRKYFFSKYTFDDEKINLYLGKTMYQEIKYADIISYDVKQSEPGYAHQIIIKYNNDELAMDYNKKLIKVLEDKIKAKE
jgi:hypothetical protein